MNEIRHHKQRSRAEALARRDALTPAERESAATAMARAAEQIEHARGEIVSGFWPIRSEPDVHPLMQALRDCGARLCLPVVINPVTIVFREFCEHAPLVPGGFGTMGPDASACQLVPRCILLPLAAFDGQGNRIGYGAGFYDRAIARIRSAGTWPLLIGIAFDCQQVAPFQPEPHDIALDAILTESGLRKFRRNG
jgi:5-formyltetrahydrofolate cyclo-ligase